jgi:hypothetical protein
MKKPASKKLRLDTESLRVLASDDLRAVQGGGRRPPTISDPTTCGDDRH